MTFCAGSAPLVAALLMVKQFFLKLTFMYPWAVLNNYFCEAYHQMASLSLGMIMLPRVANYMTPPPCYKPCGCWIFVLALTLQSSKDTRENLDLELDSTLGKCYHTSLQKQSHWSLNYIWSANNSTLQLKNKIISFYFQIFISFQACLLCKCVDLEWELSATVVVYSLLVKTVLWSIPLINS